MRGQIKGADLSEEGGGKGQGMVVVVAIIIAIVEDPRRDGVYKQVTRVLPHRPPARHYAIRKYRAERKHAVGFVGQLAEFVHARRDRATATSRTKIIN